MGLGAGSPATSPVMTPETTKAALSAITCPQPRAEVGCGMRAWGKGECEFAGEVEGEAEGEAEAEAESEA